MKIEQFDEENIVIKINEKDLFNAFEHPDYLEDFVKEVFKTIYNYVNENCVVEERKDE